MSLSQILFGIASIFLTTASSSALRLAATNSNRPAVATYSNPTAPSRNGSANNFLIHCNRQRFGQNLHVQSCFEALMQIPQDMTQKTLQCVSSQHIDMPLSYSIISCKSSVALFTMMILLLMQRISADGLCVINVSLRLCQVEQRRPIPGGGAGSVCYLQDLHGGESQSKSRETKR